MTVVAAVKMDISDVKVVPGGNTAVYFACTQEDGETTFGLLDRAIEKELDVEYIKSKKPDFLTVIYDDPDHVGHADGHGTPQYYAKMEQLDAWLGEIIAAIKEAGIYDDSIIIVTSDHGGIGTRHGGRSLMEMDTPFIVAGKNIKKIGELKNYMMQYDTAHTIAEMFGLEIPQEWRGKSISQIFE
jgi:arylsulfatase A-like enzyme